MKIYSYRVRSVNRGIGVVQIAVSGAEPAEKRKTDAGGQGKLKGAAKVLRSKMMSAQENAAGSHIECEFSILTADGQQRDERNNQCRFSGAVKNTDAGRKPYIGSPT